MTIREFTLALCTVNGEPFSTDAARTFLTEITLNGLKAVFAEMNPATFKSYFRIGRNLSKTFAGEIEAEYSLPLLKEFLKDLSTGRGGKQRLCNAFREHCPEIEPKNAINQIVRLFEEMLKDAKRGKPMKPASRTTDDTHKATKSADNNGIVYAFEKTYKKAMTLSDILPGIRAEIWKKVDEIIDTCKNFQSETNRLNHLIDLLDKAKAEKDQAKFISYYPQYQIQCNECEKQYRNILRKWAKFYKTYAHIKQIKEITQISFSHTILSPNNKMLHIAGSNTESLIEKLRQLSEDHLFT